MKATIPIKVIKKAINIIKVRQSNESKDPSNKRT